MSQDINQDTSDIIEEHLLSLPVGAPAGMTHLQMYEDGLDNMVSVNTEMGCAAFNAARPEQRQAISAASITHCFSHQEVIYLLTAAVDRLAELALQGLPVYRCQEDA